MTWLQAFALTQVVEVPVYLWLSVPRRPWVALGASALTHPVLWCVLQALGSTWPRVLVGEVAVVAVEALWLRAWAGRRPIRASLVANAASFGVGLLVQALVS